MENIGYNLRQRPFPISTTVPTTGSLATIATSLVSILSPTMSYPSTSSGPGQVDSAPTVASLCQESLGSDSARGIRVAEPLDPAAFPGEVRIQSSAANVDFFVPAANVTTANVIASTVELVQSAARPTPSVLPLLTQQQVASASVGVSNVSDVFVASAAVRAGARADRSGVHTVTGQAYDSEVSAYFRDDSPPSPAPFYYGPSPPGATSPFASVHSRADSRQSRTSYRSVSRQPRAPSRQSVMSVHSHASGRQPTHSQAADPVIDLMNKVFDSHRRRRSLRRRSTRRRCRSASQDGERDRAQRARSS